MKRIFTLSLLLALTCMPFFFSCSLLTSDEESSLSLTIPCPPSASREAAQDMIIDSSEDVAYLVIHVKGDVILTQYIKTSFEEWEKDKNKTITFDSIKNGKTVSVEANIFSYEGGWLYRGTASSFTIRSGENTVNIKMASIDTNDSDFAATASVSAGYYLTETNSVPLVDMNSQGMFVLDKAGFFEIAVGTNNLESISKGTWSGSPEKGGTIYLTEYIYSSLDTSSIGESAQYIAIKDTVIVTEQNSIAVTIKDDGSFSFKLKNGAVITGIL